MSPGKLVVTALIILVVVILPYELSNDEPLVCDSKAREGDLYSFAKITDGITHFQLSGPAAGPVVVSVIATDATLGQTETQQLNLTVVQSGGF